MCFFYGVRRRLDWLTGAEVLEEYATPILSVEDSPPYPEGRDLEFLVQFFFLQ